MVVLSVAVPSQRGIAAFIPIVGGGQVGRVGAATAPGMRRDHLSGNRGSR